MPAPNLQPSASLVSTMHANEMPTSALRFQPFPPALFRCSMLDVGCWMLDVQVPYLFPSAFATSADRTGAIGVGATRRKPKPQACSTIKNPLPHKHMNLQVTRRGFLRTTGAAVAALGLPAIVPFSAFGANDKVALGFIGVGKMGTNNLKDFLPLEEGRVVAVCDPYEERRVKAMWRPTWVSLRKLPHGWRQS